MRKSITINLADQSVTQAEIDGDALARAGRHLIAKTLLAADVAQVDPLGPDNPLIFSAGPFAGTNFSNANRISVGCKSPLTGGIKEANSGGTFAIAMGQSEIATLTLTGQSDDWVVIHHAKDGTITFDDAGPYMGLGNIDCAAKLLDAYGEKCSLALIGPVGEYGGLMSGISFTDTDKRPTRLAARGGVGAVMGSKKVKAIVLDKNRMPPLFDLKKYMTHVIAYNKYLGESPAVKAFQTTGTAMVGDLTNQLGGLPVRNFTAGRLNGPEGGPENGPEDGPEDGAFKLGGDYIRELNTARGGQISHACMFGCKIKCSNVFVDADGNELVSPLEYETLGLMGSNCGLDDPDDVARVNHVANDLGVDSIELGATIGVLMDAGQGAFGDTDYMQSIMQELRDGTKMGRLYAQGTAHVGAHFGVARVPVIKRQAISAYDPRVIEGTGVSMMLTAQGADHTVGNLPTLKTNDMPLPELVRHSVNKQMDVAIADSLGLCIFGRDVTDQHLQLIVDAINAAHGTEIQVPFLTDMAREVLQMEIAFNAAAGFDADDDALPAFFHTEPLAPSNKTARLAHAEINRLRDAILNEA